MAEMSVKTIPIRLDMRGNTQIENITKRVQEAVAETGLTAGIATVFIRHTTASVMLIEDEPGIRADTKAIWDRLIPDDARWEHNTRNPGEDNAHSHLRGHLQGPSVTIPFTDGALLDHVVLTAALARTLGIGQYTVKRVGAQSFQGDDGLGSEALVDLLHQNSTQRVYHIQSTHHGNVLMISGEAIVMLTSQTRTGSDGKESVETRMMVYSRLDNPMLATLVKVLQPFLRGVINGKLAGPFLAVHRLGELIAADPGQVSRQAETISELDKTELDALRVLLLPSLTPARP